ncbi:uncharacterized protein [Branchiostoma lanceolatum]|uniref:Hypp1835 protein n=1 Tax=Branchiostoma lanceolatum TaxID=7740 RepID=A0A8J9ZL24_BRALA|nr:Hypp1835 [Branchiostoma lanceolatum]
MDRVQVTSPSGWRPHSTSWGMGNPLSVLGGMLLLMGLVEFGQLGVRGGLMENVTAFMSMANAVFSMVISGARKLTWATMFQLLCIASLLLDVVFGVLIFLLPEEKKNLLTSFPRDTLVFIAVEFITKAAILFFSIRISRQPQMKRSISSPRIGWDELERFHRYAAPEVSRAKRDPMLQPTDEEDRPGEEEYVLLLTETSASEVTSNGTLHQDDKNMCACAEGDIWVLRQPRRKTQGKRYGGIRKMQKTQKDYRKVSFTDDAGYAETSPV